MSTENVCCCSRQRTEPHVSPLMSRFPRSSKNCDLISCFVKNRKSVTIFRVIVLCHGNNRRNCKDHNFCWAPFYLLYHLNLVILPKNAISPIFCNFWRNCRNGSFCWSLEFSNFNQNYDRSSFSQFLLLRANLDISHTLLCFVSKIGFAIFLNPYSA